MSFSNPIVGGITLIREAIQSPNYVANTSGWTINKDGSVEFNAAVIRGDVVAGNGTVVVNSSGIKVTNATSGSYVFINPGIDEATVELEPPNSLLPGVTYLPAGAYGGIAFPGIPSEQPTLFLSSPLQSNPPGPDNAFIVIFSQAQDGSAGSAITLNADTVALQVTGRVEVGDAPIVDNTYNLNFLKGLTGTELVTFVSGPNGSQAVVFAHAFPPGTTPIVICNLFNASGAVARWTVQAINITNTGFTIFAQKGAAADGNAAWTNIPIQWVAIAV